MANKFKITAPRVTQSGIEPVAIILATLRYAGARARSPRTWVLLTSEERDALSRLCRDGSRVSIADFHNADWCCDMPPLIRTHQIDVETGVGISGPIDMAYLRGQRVSWLSGESLWALAANYAPPALQALADWRSTTTHAADRISAPSWHALVGVRKLALASGAADVEP